MKHIAIGLAAAALAGAASAQSNVTLYGVIDNAYTKGYGSVSDRSQLTSSGLSSSQIGFRGVEDLGGGLKAGFWIEAGLNADNGTGFPTNTNNQPSGTTPAQGLVFNRRSTVSLGGDWGEIRLGRDVGLHYWTLVTYDPFNNLGVGVTQTLLSSVTIGLGGTAGPTVRLSNTVEYLYNHTFNALTGGGGKGFHGGISYHLGENASDAVNRNDGNGHALRLGYNNGPFSGAIALGKTEFLTGDAKQINIGAAYDFGPVRLISHITRGELGTLSGKGYLIGGTVPVGSGYIRAALSRYKSTAAGNPTSQKVALGYVHNLSKRTAVYGTVARVSNTGGAAQTTGGAVAGPNGTARGFDLGVRHIF